MKTKTEQPQHTQGKLRLPLKKEHADTIIIETNGLVPTFAICQSGKTITKEEAKANAHRIVNAVNILSEIEKELEWLNKTGAVSEYEKNIKRHYLKLLKKAKQK